jgi:uncharacterized protein (TIGR00251 family)
MNCIENRKNSIAFKIYVQPRASRTKIAGLHGDAIKVCVTAPPVENKANNAVVHLFADLFNVSKSAVSIKSGMQGRNKTVLVNNLTLKEAQAILAEILPKV